LSICLVTSFILPRPTLTTNRVTANKVRVCPPP